MKRYVGTKQRPLLPSEALVIANGDEEQALELQIVAAVAAGYGDAGFTRDDLEWLLARVNEWRTDAGLFELLRKGRIAIRRTADGTDVEIQAVTGGDA